VKTIIFDYDGTLVDSFALAMKIFNRHIVKKYKLAKVDQGDIESLKNLSSLEVIRTLNIPLTKILLVVNDYHRYFHKHAKFVKLHDGIVPMLKTLKDNGHQLGIITTNHRDVVINNLQKNNIDFFDWIYGSKNIFGKGAKIKKVIKKRKLNNEDILYIGDETRDIDAAKHAHIKSVAVTWGYNSRLALARHNPNHLITTPQELHAVVENL
jgi:phosphoglycolate phosphatase